MTARARVGTMSLVFTILVAACAPAQTPRESQVAAGAGPSAPTPPKRIVAAMMSDPGTISSSFVTAGSGTIQGGDALEDLVNAGLTIVDNHGDLIPQLGEAVPTTDNGLWILQSDGRMETRWTIKPGAKWHDGTPFTSKDLVFTAQVGQDQELPIFRHAGFSSVEAVEAPDPNTVVVRWKQPYINADEMFTRRFAFPRPKHLLEPTYLENKEAVTLHPYWTDGYVGAGPYRLRKWAAGSHVILEASGEYVLGRPKVDEIEIRFISNPNTLVANLLAGEVDLTLGRNLQLSEAMQIRDQWKEGTIGIGIKNWIAVWPQLLNPNPPVLRDVNFRRALLHAIDRQQLVDTLEYGMVPIAHAFVGATESSYKAIEPSIVKYEFDPRRSAQLIERLGYTRARDGVFQDASGQRLTLEVRTNPGHEDRILAVADYLKQVGIDAEPFLIPDARRRDREFNSTFPGVRLWRLPNDTDTLYRYHSREAPTPENRFVGGNRSRYMNPAFDALVDRYMATIPRAERISALGQIVHHMTDQLTVLGLYYNTEPVMISNRLKSITARDVGATTEAWNAHEWDVR